MAGEEKLTQINIRQQGQLIKEIPISVDTTNIIHNGRSLANIIDTDIDKVSVHQPGHANEILFIDDTGTVVPSKISLAITDSLEIPRSIVDLTGDTVDQQTGQTINQTVETYLQTIEKNHLKNFIEEDSANKYQQNIFKKFHQNVADVNQLKTVDIFNLNNFKSSQEKLNTDYTQRLNVLYQIDKDNVALPPTGKVPALELQVDALQKSIKTISGISEIPEDLTNSEILNLKSLTERVNQKMDNITIDIINDQGQVIGQEGLTQEDLIRLKKIIQIEDVAQGAALGNKTTQKIAIWGSDSNKIGLYVKHIKDNGTDFEKYGLMVRENGLYIRRYESKNNWNSYTEIYSSNEYVFGEKLDLCGGVYSGFVSDQGRKVVFFIPTVKSCKKYGPNKAGKLQFNWKSGQNKSCSIRTCAGKYLMPSLNDKNQEGENYPNFKISDMNLLAYGYQHGIRVEITHKQNSNTIFPNVTNNTPLSIYFHKSTFIEFNSK